MSGTGEEILIELTEQQQQALQAGQERPPRVFNPRTQETLRIGPHAPDNPSGPEARAPGFSITHVVREPFGWC
jgi:hypothetical protein